MGSATCKAALLMQSVTLLPAALKEEAGVGCVCVRGIRDINYRGKKPQNKYTGLPGAENKISFETFNMFSIKNMKPSRFQVISEV